MITHAVRKTQRVRRPIVAPAPATDPLEAVAAQLPATPAELELALRRALRTHRVLSAMIAGEDTGRWHYRKADGRWWPGRRA